MLQNKGHMGLTPIFSSDLDKIFFYQDLAETNIMKEVFPMVYFQVYIISTNSI